jgi:rubrerythrin
VTLAHRRKTLIRKEKVMAVKKVQKKVAKKVSKRMKEGDVYGCSVCGLSVVVDEICGCVDYCDIICCEKPMKPKRARA